MSFTEILEAIKVLPREEKVRLMHELVDHLGNSRDLTPEEAFLAQHFPPGAKFEISTPFDCFEAAAAVQQLLDAEKGRG